MNKKLVLGILIVVLAVGITFFVRLNSYGYKDSSSNNNQNSNNQTPVGVDTSNGKISLTELSKHNSLSDCWVAYDGKVYDITSFLPNHPGSAGAISPYCGTASEFQQAFTKKHGTSKVSLLMSVGTFMGDFDIIGKLNS